MAQRSAARGGFTNPAGGIVRGNGTISVGTGNTFTNSGTLRPGASPGLLTVGGNLALAANSVTEFEMNGLGARNRPGYDSIHVTGNVTNRSDCASETIYLDGSPPMSATRCWGSPLREH